MTSLLFCCCWTSLSCRILLGSVEDRTAMGEAVGGGDMCEFLLSPSSSMGNGALSEP